VLVGVGEGEDAGEEEGLVMLGRGIEEMTLRDVTTSQSVNSVRNLPG